MVKRLILFGLLAALAVPGFASAAGTPFTSANVNVAASSTEVQPAQARAATYGYIMLVNISDTTMWCNPSGAAAVVGQGVPLKKSSSSTDPDGGSWTLDSASGVPNTAINCIHGGTGNKTLIRVRDR